MSFKIIKSLFSISVFLMLFISISFCYAANLDNAFDKKINDPLNQAAGSAGYGVAVGVSGQSTKIDLIISQIITTVLSFIGVIFLVLMIYGGYIWMIARGNEQEVEKAKQIIQNAVIGLVVVVAAYAISYYVISALGATALKEVATPK